MKLLESFISSKDWPILHYAMVIAIPYVILGLLFGIFYRVGIIPDIGTSGDVIMFIFMPVSGQIVSYVGSTPWDAFMLAVNLIITLFLSWLFIAPIVGLFRAIINI